MLYHVLGFFVNINRRRGKLHYFLSVLHAYEEVSYGDVAKLPVFVDRLVLALLGRPLFVWRFIVSKMYWIDFMMLVFRALYTEVELPRYSQQGGEKEKEDYYYPGYISDYLFYIMRRLGVNPKKTSIEEGLRLAFIDNALRLQEFSFMWNLSERTVAYDDSGRGKPLEFPIKISPLANPLAKQVIVLDKRPDGEKDAVLPPWLAG